MIGSGGEEKERGWGREDGGKERVREGQREQQEAKKGKCEREGEKETEKAEGHSHYLF